MSAISTKTRDALLHFSALLDSRMPETVIENGRRKTDPEWIIGDAFAQCAPPLEDATARNDFEIGAQPITAAFRKKIAVREQIAAQYTEHSGDASKWTIEESKRLTFEGGTSADYSDGIVHLHNPDSIASGSYIGLSIEELTQLMAWAAKRKSDDPKSPK